MSQTRIQSLVEVVLNVLIGYIIATITQLIIFPLFGIYVGIGDQLLISLIFTVISIARGYVIRRWYNARIHNFAGRF